jgi:predicted permease
MLHDLRYTLRTLRHSPGLAAVAVVTMALAIGSTTAIVSVVHSVLLQPLPFPQAERVVALGEVDELGRERVSQASTSYANFADWRAGSRSFAAMALFAGFEPALTGLGEAERIAAAYTTAGIFEVLGVVPARGRPLLPSDDLPGAERVAVVSDGFWRARLGADPAALERSVVLNGRPFRVVGVLPPGLQPPGELAGELWIANDPDPRDTRSSRYMRALARLAPEVTVERARAEMRGLSAALALQHPKENGGQTAIVVPLREALVGTARQPLLLLLAAAVVLLLITCANLAGLLLARGLGRRRELAVRQALGEGRARRVRQLLLEGVVLSAAGAVLGLGLARAATRALSFLAPEALPVKTAALHPAVLATMIGATLVAGVLCGILPALRLGRMSATALRESRGLGGSRQSAARRALVVGQLGLALALLAAAGLVTRSFAALLEVDPGVRPQGVFVASLNLPAARYPAGAEPAFFARLLEEVRRLPGVESAAATSIVPFGGSWDRIAVDVGGQPELSAAERPEGDRYIVTPDYFATMGVPLHRGRLLAAEDRHDAPLVAVVDEVFARRLAAYGEPLGLRLKLPARDGWATVVGVVGHVKHYGLEATSGGQIYMSHAQYPWRWMSVVVKTGAGEPLALQPAVRGLVRELDPEQPVFGAATLQGLIERGTAGRRYLLRLVAAFAAAALLLAAVGLYGVMAHDVWRRRRELGIRMALGARPRDALRLVLAEGLRLTAAGAALGLLGAILGGRLLRGLLFGVSASDPATFVAILLVLSAAALVACGLPAARAARVDPARVLRAEE